jgi:hypothetical protein
MMAVSEAAVCGVMARRITVRGSSTPAALATRRARTTRGSTSSPPLATALVAAAICMGVTPTW